MNQNTDATSVNATSMDATSMKTKVSVRVEQFCGGKVIRTWNDVILNEPPMIGVCLAFSYQGRFYMISGTFQVIFEATDEQIS